MTTKLTLTTTERGLGWQWQKLRLTILRRDNYLCQPCLRSGRPTEAKEVDHITPRAKDGSDDPDNLEGICRPCHIEKTKQDMGRKPTLLSHQIRERTKANKGHKNKVFNSIIYINIGSFSIRKAKSYVHPLPHVYSSYPLSNRERTKNPRHAHHPKITC